MTRLSAVGAKRRSIGKDHDFVYSESTGAAAVLSKSDARMLLSTASRFMTIQELVSQAASVMPHESTATIEARWRRLIEVGLAVTSEQAGLSHAVPGIAVTTVINAVAIVGSRNEAAAGNHWRRALQKAGRTTRILVEGRFNDSRNQRRAFSASVVSARAVPRHVVDFALGLDPGCDVSDESGGVISGQATNSILLKTAGQCVLIADESAPLLRTTSGAGTIEIAETLLGNAPAEWQKKQLFPELLTEGTNRVRPLPIGLAGFFADISGSCRITFEETLPAEASLAIDNRFCFPPLLPIARGSLHPSISIVRRAAGRSCAALRLMPDDEDGNVPYVLPDLAPQIDAGDIVASLLERAPERPRGLPLDAHYRIIGRFLHDAATSGSRFDELVKEAAISTVALDLRRKHKTLATAGALGKVSELMHATDRLRALVEGYGELLSYWPTLSTTAAAAMASEPQA